MRGGYIGEVFLGMPGDNMALGAALCQECSLSELQQLCELGVVQNEML